VAFKTPAGKTVLIVANTGDSAKDFSVRNHGATMTTSLAAGSVATYIW
jgi:glucosylceramidase